MMPNQVKVAETTAKTSMLRVFTCWQSNGTSVSMLVKDMSRNKCSVHVWMTHVLHLISIHDLFTDSPLYQSISKPETFNKKYQILYCTIRYNQVQWLSGIRSVQHKSWYFAWTLFFTRNQLM
jgi:hypothetical protein